MANEVVTPHPTATPSRKQALFPNPVRDMIANGEGSLCQFLASNSGGIDYLNLIAGVGGLMVVLLATVAVVLFLRRWWQQVRSGEPTQPQDLLGFRSLYEKGELSAQELEAIQGVLEERSAAGSPPPPPPETPASPPSPPAFS